MDSRDRERRAGLVSIVIPAYNTGPVVGEVVAGVREGLGDQVEVIVVDDGSAEPVAQWLDERVEVVTLVVNSGKGAALCEGFARAQGEVVGYIDGDGELDAAALGAMVRRLRSGECDGVLGERGVLGRRSWWRRAGTVAFGLWVRWRLGFARGVAVGVGAKVFWGEGLEEAVALCRERGYAFDAEMLAVMRAMGKTRFCSVPIMYRPSGTSTMSVKRLIGEIGAVGRIRARVRQLA
jgi:glycosyltransferase involved in cell wall biosynthesis